MGVINPFDFFIEDYAERSPFAYPPELAADLKPYLESPAQARGPALDAWLAALPAGRRTVASPRCRSSARSTPR